MFKTFVVATLAIVLGVVAFYLIERELGERAWRKYQVEAAAKGVKLYLRDYVKAPIPDEENYAAAPIFQRLFSDPADVEKARDQWRLPEIPRAKPGKVTAKHFDLEVWQKAFVAYRWIPAKGSDPAADVLAALQKLEQPLSEIRRASQRPKSRWPVKWENDMGAPYPHFSVISPASTVFVLRAAALLEQGKPEEALTELRYAIRAADSLKGEPAITSGLVRIVQWSKVMDCVEQGMTANQWKADQLRELRQELAKAELIHELVFALTSERGMGNGMFERLITTDRATWANQSSSLGRSDSLQTKALLYAMPRGWIRRNQVEYNQLIDLDLEDIDVGKGRIDPRFCRSFKVITANAATLVGKLNHLFTSVMLPAHEPVAYKSFHAHVRAEQLRVLIAASQYRAKHNELPPTLDSLVPEFLASLPADPMDGNPLRYRRTDEGGCLIWSIGKNRIDDGGKTGIESSPSKALDWVTELPPSQGNAVTPR